MRFNIFYFRNIPDFLQKRDKEGKKEKRKGGNEAIEKTAIKAVEIGKRQTQQFCEERKTGDAEERQGKSEEV